MHVQVMDTLALNCSPHVRTQLAGKHFLQRAASLAGGKRPDVCAQAALQMLVDWAFIYKCAPAFLVTWLCWRGRPGCTQSACA